MLAGASGWAGTWRRDTRRRRDVLVGFSGLGRGGARGDNDIAREKRPHVDIHSHRSFASTEPIQRRLFIEGLHLESVNLS